jgi:hypothetical protein
MKSLQDQLLNSGLVDEKKLKQVKRDKRKQAKQQPKGAPAPVDEIKLAAQQARAEQVERDRQRNRQLQQAAEQKAIAAQIVQLIDSHRIARSGDVPYQFADQGKIKKLLVNDVLQRQLSRGQVAIVRRGDSYQLIPAAIAAKIRERDPQAVLVLHQAAEQVAEEDDPYADYPIPDDLMW